MQQPVCAPGNENIEEQLTGPAKVSCINYYIIEVKLHMLMKDAVRPGQAESQLRDDK